ncbi:inositol polyphosphate 5-phosphatase [Pleurotus ostreatus]|uniref:phosphoinositide 5-phosphatase n=1 Tax=Pleurotus ostreatus TaxID=5322 RepID=A0A8H7A2S0_PLEOS|nr:inositol polyphosphate 5-phosphatase [Pleurotus ostreatus]KAF7432917.1 inositol polyphosphate 5-phosphatase [Pleurotus ostreatus]
MFDDCTRSIVDNTPKYSTSLRRVQAWAFLHFTLYVQVQFRAPGGTVSNPAVEAKMYLYLGSNPRSLYLLTSPQDEKVGRPHRGLVFRCNEANPTQAIVEFLPKREIDISSLVKLTNRVVKGCLGLIAIENDIFLAVVTSATEVGNARPSKNKPEVVARIHEVSFYSLTSSVWDDFTAASDALPTPDAIDAMMRDNYTQSNPQNQVLEHPCVPLTKILSSGSFYYAVDSSWDLSSRLSRRLARDPSMAVDIAVFDERFVWNEYIVRSLLDFRERMDPHDREDFDRCQFIILAIQGYAGIFTMALPAPPTNGTPAITTLSLISRLGWKRAGTRFNTRGVDDDGNCANFVETEIIFSTDQHCVSYVQVRGSVPLFWEQQGFQTFGQRIQITRPQGSQPAFERHFRQLIEEYGAVHVINLLGTKENEVTLTTAYTQHLKVARGSLGDDLDITPFDFHNAVRLVGHDGVVREISRIENVVDHIDRFGFTMCDATSDDIITDQKGVFRTNCLDCLDRTNFVQDILSRTTIEQYLHLVRLEWIQSNTLWGYHRELWAENGDALSKIYAGTGALNTSFTRSGKRTLAGVLSDATKSVSRAYINNFQDKGKQVAIDMFLGNMSNQKPVIIFDPIHDSVRTALEQRAYEYSTNKRCTIFVGTWNVNGRAPSESLVPWLFPRDGLDDPDIFVLGFQEIVPLTAQQIVQADPEKRRVWETKILETLDQYPNKTSNYVLLRSEQLVGTALLVLVKSELTGVMRHVEAATRKTGLRGMSGNKGAVGVRLEYHDTSFCFLTAHLAAGHLNVEERNADYRTIANGLHFQKGKTINSHDNVIWLADTNYRIDLDNEVVRGLAQAQEFDALVAADQLRQAIDSKAAFAGYEEGPLLFRPTYRYDLGTSTYDTSEKARIPAWTDRVLYRGKSLDLSVYSCSELKGSDHKPVYALFRADVRVIDAYKKAALSRLLLESVTSTEPGERLDEKLAKLSLPVNYSELPPPSSDDSAWWDGPDHPSGVIPLAEIMKAHSGPQNLTDPFDVPDSPASESVSSSDEELFEHALNLQTPLAPTKPVPRKPPPPPPRSKNTTDSQTPS